MCVGYCPDDQSNDVQTIAVKCLAIITRKVQQDQIREICRKLCSLILDSAKGALRDVYAIGLKTLIADVPDRMGELVGEQITAKIMSGIARTDSEDIQRECLEIMTDLLRRFGHLNVRYHNDLLGILLQQLNSNQVVVRKRTAHCLGALAVVSSDVLLSTVVTSLLEGIQGKAASHQHARTLIHTIGTISRTVGFRLGKYLDRIVPLFLTFCGDPLDESQHNDAANELRENCFPGKD